MRNLEFCQYPGSSVLVPFAHVDSLLQWIHPSLFLSSSLPLFLSSSLSLFLSFSLQATFDQATPIGWLKNTHLAYGSCSHAACQPYLACVATWPISTAASIGEESEHSVRCEAAHRPEVCWPSCAGRHENCGYSRYFWVRVTNRWSRCTPWERRRSSVQRKCPPRRWKRRQKRIWAQRPTTHLWPRQHTSTTQPRMQCTYRTWTCCGSSTSWPRQQLLMDWTKVRGSEKFWYTPWTAALLTSRYLRSLRWRRGPATRIWEARTSKTELEASLCRISSEKTAWKNWRETIRFSAVSKHSVNAPNAPCHLPHKRLPRSTLFSTTLISSSRCSKLGLRSWIHAAADTGFKGRRGFGFGGAVTPPSSQTPI